MIYIPEEEDEYPAWWHLRDAGYAPGSYSCTCHTCGTDFAGDKRARRCRPCAESLTNQEDGR